MLKTLLAAGAAMLWAGAAAADTPAQHFTLNVGECPAAAPTEDADQAIVHQAILDFNRNGYARLARALPDLETALRHAPACYPLIERRNGEIQIRTMDENEYALLAGILSAAPGANEDIVMTPNTYGNAALLLSSYAVEMRDYTGALAWADIGLALQPDNQLLINEKGVALSASGRFQEAFDLYEATLNNPVMGLTLDRAGYLRRRGIVLIDLERLDEAEASLNEVLRLDPNDQMSRDELIYIAHLRGGGARTPYTVLPNTPPQDNNKKPI